MSNNTASPSKCLLIHTFTVAASYNMPEGLVGIGMVLQATDKPNRRGAILETFEEIHQATAVSNKDMEKFAVFQALQISADRGYRRVKTRSNYSYIRTQLKKDHASGLVYDRDELHRQILRLAQSFELVQFGYCPRRKNQIAHRLARKAVGIKTKRKDDGDTVEAWEHELWADEAFEGASQREHGIELKSRGLV